MPKANLNLFSPAEYQGVFAEQRKRIETLAKNDNLAHPLTKQAFTKAVPSRINTGAADLTEITQTGKDVVLLDPESLHLLSFKLIKTRAGEIVSPTDFDLRFAIGRQNALKIQSYYENEVLNPPPLQFRTARRSFSPEMKFFIGFYAFFPTLDPIQQQLTELQNVFRKAGLPVKISTDSLDSIDDAASVIVGRPKERERWTLSSTFRAYNPFVGLNVQTIAIHSPLLRGPAGLNTLEQVLATTRDSGLMVNSSSVSTCHIWHSLTFPKNFAELLSGQNWNEINRLTSAGRISRFLQDHYAAFMAHAPDEEQRNLPASNDLPDWTMFPPGKAGTTETTVRAHKLTVWLDPRMADCISVPLYVVDSITRDCQPNLALKEEPARKVESEPVRPPVKVLPFKLIPETDLPSIFADQVNRYPDYLTNRAQREIQYVQNFFTRIRAFFCEVGLSVRNYEDWREALRRNDVQYFAQSMHEYVDFASQQVRHAATKALALPLSKEHSSSSDALSIPNLEALKKDASETSSVGEELHLTNVREGADNIDRLTADLQKAFITDQHPIMAVFTMQQNRSARRRSLRFLPRIDQILLDTISQIPLLSDELREQLVGPFEIDAKYTRMGRSALNRHLTLLKQQRIDRVGLPTTQELSRHPFLGIDNLNALAEKEVQSMTAAMRGAQAGLLKPIVINTRTRRFEIADDQQFAFSLEAYFPSTVPWSEQIRGLTNFLREQGYNACTRQEWNGYNPGKDVSEFEQRGDGTWILDANWDIHSPFLDKNKALPIFLICSPPLFGNEGLRQGDELVSLLKDTGMRADSRCKCQVVAAINDPLPGDFATLAETEEGKESVIVGSLVYRAEAFIESHLDEIALHHPIYPIVPPKISGWEENYRRDITKAIPRLKEISRQDLTVALQYHFPAVFSSALFDSISLYLHIVKNTREGLETDLSLAPFEPAGLLGSGHVAIKKPSTIREPSVLPLLRFDFQPDQKAMRPFQEKQNQLLPVPLPRLDQINQHLAFLVLHDAVHITHQKEQSAYEAWNRTATAVDALFEKEMRGNTTEKVQINAIGSLGEKLKKLEQAHKGAVELTRILFDRCRDRLDEAATDFYRSSGSKEKIPQNSNERPYIAVITRLHFLGFEREAELVFRMSEVSERLLQPDVNTSAKLRERLDELRSLDSSHRRQVREMPVAPTRAMTVAS